ncbi:unnamed protein product [Rodentolepis nana]|uniref:Dynein regulatory complex subunit 5-like n=1 Tax=Rodentolepis nana TaxID=102285 RepID=A0A0R3TMF2_RODNA|nr:unnamed protein product [Rodentolepis nana]
MNPDAPELEEVRESRTLSFLKKNTFQSRENGSFIFSDKINEFERILANRRFKAEDRNFDPDKVPPLKDLSLKQIIENFSFDCSAVHCLNKDQLKQVLDTLPTTIPLKVAASAISDGPFWKRMALSRWKVVDIARHGNSWKRAFFEKHVEQTIEEFIPGDTAPSSVDETLDYAANYIQSIKIKEMLPPTKDSKLKEKFPFVKTKKNVTSYDDDSQWDFEINEDESSSSEDEEEYADPQADHLDLGPVIDKLTNLTHLSVQYRVRDAGFDFEWDDFLFTGQDCISFSKVVGAHKLLTVLELKNRVDCSKCRVLARHLINHPSLTVLNLSHNVISDLGARSLSKLISGRSRIECLDLTDNQLGIKGGAAIGQALGKENCTITKLNLRLNRIKDAGAISIAKALQRNKRLKELNLAANGFGDPSFNAFGEALSYNSGLEKFDLSNNSISVEAGKRFQEYVACNKSLIYLDLRLTGISQDFELLLQKNIEKNHKFLQKQEENAETNYITISGLTNVAVNERNLDLEAVKPKPHLFVTNTTSLLLDAPMH